MDLFAGRERRPLPTMNFSYVHFCTSFNFFLNDAHRVLLLFLIDVGVDEK